MRDEPLKKCPACGKRSLRKLVSAGAFQLKGTGWYVTDFKDKPKEKSNKKKSVEPAKSDSVTSDTKKSATDTAKSTKKESAPTATD